MKTLLIYRKPIGALFAAIVFALTLHGVSHAQTHIHVDAVNGINAPTGRGSAANPYQSITFALLLSTRNNLPDPWHVHIHPGTYDADFAKPANAREIFPLKLRREMIFEGTTTAEECIIDGQHTGGALVPILSGEDTEGATIRNLTIQNSLRTNGTGGIVLHDPTGTNETPSTLEGCIVHNNKGGGVWSNMPLILTGNTFSNNHGRGVETTKSTAATNNIFSGNHRTGLHIEGNSTGSISKNIFQNNAGQGFYVKQRLDSGVTDNTFTGNRSPSHSSGGGFHVGHLTGNVANNTFTGNSAYRNGGFAVGTFTGNVTHNTFDSNRAIGGGGGGFGIRSITGNVTDNEFTNNTSGESGDSSSGGGFQIDSIVGNVTHNEFTRNKVVDGGGGFKIDRITGKITHNIFDSNSAHYSGGFELRHTSTNTVEVSNNIFFNNTSSGTGNAVGTRHATHFMNNLFMISDELSEGVSGPHTVSVSSPECRFHNNIFTNVKIAIYTGGTFDLPITHNLFHNVRVGFVDQAGNNLGNDLLFWELVAVNATNNLEGAPQLVDPVTTRDFHLQATSPAIDAGTNAFAPADDFDEVARPIGNTVDIGPYEYGAPPVVTTQAPIVPDDPPSEPTEDTPPAEQAPIVPDDPPSEPTEDTPPAEPTLKLYWATGSKIQRGDLDGANIEDVVNREAVSLALDAENGKIYWVQPDNGIFRANLLDGTNIEHLITDDIEGFSGGRIALDVAGGKMYWTHGETNSIFRANLDGTNAESLLQLRVGTLLDIALDVAGGKMYWTQWEGNASISRANLDGSNIELLINPGDKQSLALDIAGGKMYWTDGFNGIGMSNLDGSNVNNFQTPKFTTRGITLVLSNGTMYWIDGEGTEIRRSNLDGSQQHTILRSSLSDIALYFLEGTPSSTTTSVENTYPAWDVNEDGQTDVTDFALVAAALGQAPPGNPRLDVNGDGTVDLQDLALIAQHLGESTAPAAPAQVVLPASLTPQTVQRALNLLRAQDNGSPAFQRGIALLEQLLASLVPKETALLANYPNPFNPETWIPYQLAVSANVTLRLYSADGKLVRRISLGHQMAGIYHGRSRAAYWDGTNEQGEPVASGVYFYTLTAGDFTATRKMLIRK